MPKVVVLYSTFEEPPFQETKNSQMRIVIANDHDLVHDQPEAKTVANQTKHATEVLASLCDGKTNKEIAHDLNLKDVTMKLYVQTLCRKLSAKTRTQAAMIARDQKLI